jgi:hypothetical protein
MILATTALAAAGCGQQHRVDSPMSGSLAGSLHGLSPRNQSLVRREIGQARTQVKPPVNPPTLNTTPLTRTAGLTARSGSNWNQPPYFYTTNGWQGPHSKIWLEVDAGGRPDQPYFNNDKPWSLAWREAVTGGVVLYTEPLHDDNANPRFDRIIFAPGKPRGFLDAIGLRAGVLALRQSVPPHRVYMFKLTSLTFS